jgi:hypothetical protein
MDDDEVEAILWHWLGSSACRRKASRVMSVYFYRSYQSDWLFFF